MYDSLIYLGVAMVVLYAIGLIAVAIWVLGSIWGAVSTVAEELWYVSTRKRNVQVRKKSRLP